MTGAIGGEDAVSDWETQDGSPVRGTPLHLRKFYFPQKHFKCVLGHILGMDLLLQCTPTPSYTWQ